MMRALLIDDEELTIQALEKIITDTYKDIQIVGKALNGLDGIKLINELNPDIIFLDIKMPQMDGISLLKESNAGIRGIKVIILSAFKEFNYAQQALRYGATDYLLKPFGKDNIIKVLKNLKNMHNKEINAFQEDFLKRLIDDKNNFPRHKFMDSDYYNFIFWEEKTTKLAVKEEQKNKELLAMELIKNMGPGNLYFIGRRRLFIFKPIKEKLSILNMYISIEKVLEKNYVERVYLSQSDENYESILRRIEDVLSEIWLKNYSGQYWIRSVQSLDKVNRDYQKLEHFTVYQWRDEFIYKNKLKFKEWMMQKKQDYIKYQKPIQFMLQDMEYTLFDLKRFIESKGQYEEIIKKLNNLMDRKTMIEVSLDEILTEIEEIWFNFIECESHLGQEGRLVKEIKQYCRTHMDKCYSLQELSEIFHLNKNYLSTLFKANSGQNLFEYIEEMKINEAKTLLKSSNQTIVCIAKSLGYDNASNFGRKFKKTVGMTPKRYREKSSDKLLNR